LIVGPWILGSFTFYFDADEVKNGPQLRVGVISEILSEGIFMRVVETL
jgi:hypothetical protein